MQEFTTEKFHGSSPYFDEATLCSHRAEGVQWLLPGKAAVVADMLCRLSVVESRCGAVAVGRTYLFPPLSSGGALVVRPWLRFHIPLIEPDRRLSRIRLSDKTSRLCLAYDAFCSS